jgi:hypothetical protein
MDKIIQDESIMHELITQESTRLNNRARILRAKDAVIFTIIFWLLMVLILLPWALKS